MTIIRLIAEPTQLSARLESLNAELGRHGVALAGLDMLAGGGVVELCLEGSAELSVVRAALDAHLAPADVLIARGPVTVPSVFVSDMDSTMIGQECIDELADFAGLKPQIAEITERAMQGELNFETALRERVALLAGLGEGAIQRCIAERIRPMPGAKVLVETLKSLGCRTVLVTGGFHQFADPVAEILGFERVVANRLEIVNGKLTGGLIGGICHSGTKLAAHQEEVEALGEGTVSLATGDGANDIPMIEAATYGVAYHAKPKARSAANGWIDRGDLTSVLRLLGVGEDQWVKG